MPEINRLILQDEDGKEYSIFIESMGSVTLPQDVVEASDEYESYGISDEVKVKLKDVHETLQAYARYSIGAFKNIALAEVEEMVLRFKVKIAGKAGLPVLTESSAEGAFEIELKCKLKD